MRRLHLTVHAACAVLLAAAIAGCGDSEDSSSGDSSSPGSDATLGAAATLVPADLEGESLSAVVMQDYPPYGFVDNGEIVGLNPDIIRAISADSGLDFKIDGSSWDAMIPGLQAGRWDLMHASAIITPDRLEIFDFVSTDKNYTAFVTEADSDVTIEEATDVCGLSFSVVKGSVDGTTVEDINENECEPNGLEPATLQTFAGNDAAILAATSGRVDAVSMSGSTVPDLMEKTGDKFVEQPFQGGVTYGGIALEKGSPLGPVVLQAMKDLVENGTYEDIYSKYNSTASMLDEPELITG
ncbi:polar amino acid transport system substrate-binding protein/glutamine transport system substrate-binding protein [Nocardioides sp. J9]|uniref:transporter substrate-binding domain-containing protein n=1 Tax=Nocardioides sp. J9 TaxID=935844 RepID=UPI0011A757F3|nr:transporter substrate-binding domain-containing protein [Nocardioides sp. J9]TWH01730.1 polar amino acid transport system substrate-binding protein/glutamine transport system substrate-binding protein [Nocardioides sp. J9]